jgi:hypothetical protein
MMSANLASAVSRVQSAVILLNGQPILRESQRTLHCLRNMGMPMPRSGAEGVARGCDEVERAVRGWGDDGPATRQDGTSQACRPYLSVTAAATNFLRPALPGLVPWAVHQSGNVAGSM